MLVREPKNLCLLGYFFDISMELPFIICTNTYICFTTTSRTLVIEIYESFYFIFFFILRGLWEVRRVALIVNMQYYKYIF